MWVRVDPSAVALSVDTITFVDEAPVELVSVMTRANRTDPMKSAWSRRSSTLAVPSACIAGLRLLTDVTSRSAIPDPSSPRAERRPSQMLPSSIASTVRS